MTSYCQTIGWDKTQKQRVTHTHTKQKPSTGVFLPSPTKWPRGSLCAFSSSTGVMVVLQECEIALWTRCVMHPFIWGISTLQFSTEIHAVFLWHWLEPAFTPNHVLRWKWLPLFLSVNKQFWKTFSGKSWDGVTANLIPLFVLCCLVQTISCCDIWAVDLEYIIQWYISQLWPPYCAKDWWSQKANVFLMWPKTIVLYNETITLTPTVQNSKYF